ncbi:MAG: hypothetical protein JJU13_12530 [Balneolaceae bacterium]|nr:hypothetical protein [Balneolaceae bacterium]
MNKENKLLESLKSFHEMIIEINKSQGIDRNKKGYYYSSPFDLIIQEGRIFKSIKLTSNETIFINNVIERYEFNQGECFYNSQLICAFDKTNKIEYWEGFTDSFPVGIPVIHGFNVLNGKVIDVTLKIDGKPILGIYPNVKEYIGIKIPKEIVIDRFHNHPTSISFIDNLSDGFPLLKYKLDNTK